MNGMKRKEPAGSPPNSGIEPKIHLTALSSSSTNSSATSSAVPRKLMMAKRKPDGSHTWLTAEEIVLLTKTKAFLLELKSSNQLYQQNKTFFHSEFAKMMNEHFKDIPGYVPLTTEKVGRKFLMYSTQYNSSAPGSKAYQTSSSEAITGFDDIFDLLFSGSTSTRTRSRSTGTSPVPLAPSGGAPVSYGAMSAFNIEKEYYELPQPVQTALEYMSGKGSLGTELCIFTAALQIPHILQGFQSINGNGDGGYDARRKHLIDCYLNGLVQIPELDGKKVSPDRIFPGFKEIFPNYKEPVD